MKNNVKKVLALVVALTLALAMAIPAFAASITVDVKGETNRTFSVYQIFTGKISDGKLTAIEFGSGFDASDIQAVAQEVLGTAADASATAIAEALAANEDKAVEFAEKLQEKAKTTSATLNSANDFTADVVEGYYLVVDDTTLTNTGMVRSSVILKVLGDEDIEIKTSTPSVDKTISKVDDEDTTADNNKGATAEIGDVIEFTLTGTLPSNYDDFDTYYYAFHDTLSKGLTYNYDVTVTINGEPVDSALYDATYDPLTGKLDIVFDDLKLTDAEADDTIVVTYTATLNDGAVMGSEGNVNEVYLEYDNDPYEDGHGTSETKKVYVYTFGIEFEKVNGKTDRALQGAGFMISREGEDGTEWGNYDPETGWTWGDKEDASEFFSDGEGKFTIKGLEPGDYTLHETTTPPGYNTMDDIDFTIDAEWDHTTGVITPDPTITVEDHNDVVVGNTREGSTTVGYEDVETGYFELTLKNYEGSTLPGTGGIGTTIFYTVGAIVVAAALAYLCISNVQKKRATRG